MPELETDRLLLRQFSLDDLDDLARLFADGRVTRYMGTRGETATREESEVALRSIIDHWGRHGFGRWAAVLKGEGRLIGYGGLRAYAGDGELVYLVDHPYWGRGLATEMARACLRFGFEVKSFGRVVGLAKPENAASRRVLEKAGMRFRRVVRYYAHMAELGIECNAAGREDIDIALYEITATEFGRRTQTPQTPPGL